MVILAAKAPFKEVKAKNKLGGIGRRQGGLKKLGLYGKFTSFIVKP